MFWFIVFIVWAALVALWFWLDTKPWKKLPGLFSCLIGGRRGHRSV